MSFARQTPAHVHRQHLETLALIDRIDSALAKTKPATAAEPAWMSVQQALALHLTGETERHFALEQDHLFPVLQASGDGDIADLLTEEHEAITAVAAQILALIGADGRRALSPAEWGQFRQLALEFVERQVGHIQKEEMSLLPVLDDALDEERDAELLETCLATA
jgi:hemerythrin-like domain-containing protein